MTALTVALLQLAPPGADLDANLVAGEAACRQARSSESTAPENARHADVSHSGGWGDRTKPALLKNPYDADPARDGDRRIIRRLVIDDTWFTGEPTAPFG